jgi:hypothetical protein
MVMVSVMGAVGACQFMSNAASSVLTLLSPSYRYKYSRGWKACTCNASHGCMVDSMSHCFCCGVRRLSPSSPCNDVPELTLTFSKNDSNQNSICDTKSIGLGHLAVVNWLLGIWCSDMSYNGTATRDGWKRVDGRVYSGRSTLLLPICN